MNGVLSRIYEEFSGRKLQVTFDLQSFISLGETE
jgi:hypothetical protein